MKTWRNGQKGKTVKEVIDDNFSNLDKRLSSTSYRYEISIAQSNWNDGRIYIPYTTHKISTPCVTLYILEGDYYSPVVGGVFVDAAYNVVLETDLPFKGKVVIK